MVDMDEVNHANEAYRRLVFGFTNILGVGPDAAGSCWADLLGG